MRFWLRCALLLAIAGTSHVQAEDKPLLTLAQAVERAAARQGHVDPFELLGLRQRLPGACQPPALGPVLAGPARAEQQARLNTGIFSLFLDIQDLENRLLAAGEQVAASYLDWQRNAARPVGADGLPAQEALRGESVYLQTLEQRESLRLQLREKLHQLGGMLGESGSLAVTLDSTLPEGVAVPPDLERLPDTPRQAALGLMRTWWQDRDRPAGRVRSLCLRQIRQLQAEVDAQVRMEDDLTRARTAFLQRYRIPAARAHLRLAEAELDLARSGAPGAPRLGDAMTRSLLAAGALRFSEGLLALDAIRSRSRSTGCSCFGPSEEPADAIPALAFDAATGSHPPTETSGRVAIAGNAAALN